MDLKKKYNELDDETKASIQTIFDFIDEYVQDNIKELKSSNLEEVWGETFYDMLEVELSYISVDILEKIKFNLTDFLFNYFVKSVEKNSAKKKSQELSNDILKEIETYCIKRIDFYRINLEKDNMLHAFCENPFIYTGLLESYFKDLLLEIKKEILAKNNLSNINVKIYKPIVKEILIKQFSFPKNIIKEINDERII